MARSLQERLAHAAGQGTEAVAGALRAWAGAVGRLTRSLPDPDMVVDGAFDVAEEVLRAQRQAALTVLRVARGGRDPRWPPGA
jgi:hypothetical protein